MAIPIPSSSPSPPWIELPTDLTSNILKRLNSLELIECAQRVCSTWWNVCKDPEMWRVIDMSYPIDIYEDYPYDFREIFRHAVDRSQGESIDINMYGLVRTDELLQYLSTRSSQLRRLRLDRCYGISAEGLIEAVQNIPYFEELYISTKSSLILPRDIGNIGLSCPTLKSFTFLTEYQISYKSDDISVSGDILVAISKTMANLRHLRLGGVDLMNAGLTAILDGCPHLVSLDLSGCLAIQIDESLRKLCSQRVKDLRLPRDFMDDFDFDFDFDD